jgi:cysteine-rich repeat protein
MRIRSRFAAIWVAVALAACSVDPVVLPAPDGPPPACGDGVVDPSTGEVCDDGNRALGDGCSADCRSTEVCGNGVVDGVRGEVCDDGNTSDGDGCSADCMSDETCGNEIVDTAAGEVCDDGIPVGGPCSFDCKSGLGCGNGELNAEIGEECDDGDTNDADDCVVGTSAAYECRLARCGDGIVALDATGSRREQCDGGAPDHSSAGPVETASCDLDCTVPVCGDGTVNSHAGEQCDDGDGVNGNGCDSNCTPTRCGNGIVSAGEGCDDGNLVNGDGCDANCKPSGCGNGVVTGSEQCDDGNNVNADGCDNNCKLSGCGNGVTAGTETCDDGNLTDGDGCDSNCKKTGCRNGIVTVGETCDDGNSLNGDGCDNNCTVTGCGNGALSAPESCDDGNIVDDDGCDSNCKPSGCGNGVVVAPEVCDDGNLTSGDGCDSNCKPSGCGNGVVVAPESCDDGNLTNGDGCDSNCRASGCGSGVVVAPEICDDGNLTSGDGCDSNCQVTGCGNGVVAGFEVCDDGNQTNGDGCDVNCTVTACRNHVVTAGEQCDDGNSVNGDGCDNNCQPTSCGNGVPTGTEQCDDGNTVNGDGCDNNCTPTGCGNHVVVPPELCDDGNATNGDGCDRNCTPTRCGNGVVVLPEVCDDGNQTNGDGCDGNCRPTGCGNGVVTAGEQCDDGNSTNGDGCDNNCTQTACGNGIVSAGEQCDDANLTSGDGCDQNCTLTACGNGIVTTGEQCDDGNQRNGDGCDNDCTLSAITYIKASNTGVSDLFGFNVALSADGSTLAVGAYNESSAATGINGNQVDNSAGASGAVYVFTRSGATWVQQAYIKASNTGAVDQFGFRLALSADGSTLAVGAFREDSAVVGINGNQADNSAQESGAVYVFTRSGTTWSQQAYVKASNTNASDLFGASVALSADGSTLAVGARLEDSAAAGIDGNQLDNSLPDSGAVYVFTRSGTTWSQQAYVKASNPGSGDELGFYVALSNDGATLAVGAYNEDSAATGINGNQLDNSSPSSGAVYVFTRSGATWSQQAYVKASNTGVSDRFGIGVALSGDGSILAVGADLEDSAAVGVNGSQLDNSATDSGAVYVFARSGTTWSQQAYVKASNTGASDFFGYSVALSGDGSILAVGAYGEASTATGIGGNQFDNSAPYAGAAYVLARSGTTWSQQAYVKASNTNGSDFFSTGIGLSVDGSTMAVGAYQEASAATGVGGDQANNSAPGSGAVYVFD